MIRVMALPGQATRAQLSAEQVDSIERSALRIESEDGDSEFIGPHPSCWNHTVAYEDQCPPTVSDRNRSRPLHPIDIEVATLIVDPRNAPDAIEIAHLDSSARSHDSVGRAEVDHPFAAQLDCFIVRSALKLRRRRLPFHRASLPETSVASTCVGVRGNEMSALARSLTAPSSQRSKSAIADWS